MRYEQVLHVGFQNYVLGERIVAILGAEGIPMKRLRNEAYQHGKLIDATRGRKTHALILTDSDHIILSVSYPDTLIKRWNTMNAIKEGEIVMPIHRCQRENKQGVLERGWQYGNQKCFLPSEEGGDEAAKERALEQGRAIEANQNQEVKKLSDYE